MKRMCTLVFHPEDWERALLGFHSRRKTTVVDRDQVMLQKPDHATDLTQEI